MADDANLPPPAPDNVKRSARELELLDADPRRYLVRERPVADALRAALQKPRDVVMREYREALRAWAASDDDSMPGLKDTYGPPIGAGPACISVVASAVVTKAMLGDPSATQLLADRVEGRATPALTIEVGADRQRAEMAAGLEEIVRALNARPGDGARDVTREATKPNGHDDGGGHGG